jgi:DNA-binding helix-hairpin-helix protein with protein kinase domain
VKLPNGRPIKLASKELGQGAEGVVRAIQDTEDICAKIYFEPAADIESRLKALKRHAAAKFEGDHGEHVHLAWPLERLLDDDGGGTVGFVMPRIEGVKLSLLTERDGRFAALDSPTWGTLVTVAERTARLVDRLHRAGVVIGDLSPANVLVTRTGHVTFIDCDTVQFTDPQDNRQHHCRKLTPRYAPPGAAAQDRLAESHDNFSLALLITELLMVGQHPFDGVPVRGTGSTIDNINNQNNRIVFPERLVDVPNAIPATVLPPDVLALAMSCFGPGHRDPAHRPDSQAWTQALSIAALQVMGCRNNPNHSYHRSLGTQCVWCTRVWAKLGDTFPAFEGQFAGASRGPDPAPGFRPPPIPVPRKPRQAPPKPPPTPTPIRVPTRPPAAPPPISRPVPPPMPRPVPAPAASGGSSGWVAWVVVAIIVIILIVIFL